MVNWTSISILFLICHGGYSKPQYQNEGEPEEHRRELGDQDDAEPGYVPDGMEFLVKRHISFIISTKVIMLPP